MLQGYSMLFDLMEVLGKKWIGPLLLVLLFYENSSFSKIKKQLGMTSRALSKKLKLLEALGLIDKIVLSPRRVIYALSEKGKKTAGLLLRFSAFTS